mmetsp:Transcript_7821/g.18725  ORF Transcript_7821/g.18725 Transcript_7821/m.18725 type:complete len:437 (-) Transcript_7821:1121-2431(-)
MHPLLPVGGPPEGAELVGAEGAASVRAAPAEPALALPPRGSDLGAVEAPRLELVLVLLARPAEPLAARDLVHAVALLVHADVAALAEHDHVGRLAVPLPADDASRIVVDLPRSERVQQVMRAEAAGVLFSAGAWRIAMPGAPQAHHGPRGGRCRGLEGRLLLPQLLLLPLQLGLPPQLLQALQALVHVPLRLGLPGGLLKLLRYALESLLEELCGPPPVDDHLLQKLALEGEDLPGDLVVGRVGQHFAHRLHGRLPGSAFIRASAYALPDRAQHLGTVRRNPGLPFRMLHGRCFRGLQPRHSFGSRQPSLGAAFAAAGGLRDRRAGLCFVSSHRQDAEPRGYQICSCAARFESPRGAADRRAQERRARLQEPAGVGVQGIRRWPGLAARQLRGKTLKLGGKAQGAAGHRLRRPERRLRCPRARAGDVEAPPKTDAL